MIQYPIPARFYFVRVFTFACFSGWFPYDLFEFKWKIIVIVIYIDFFLFIS